MTQYKNFAFAAYPGILIVDKELSSGGHVKKAVKVESGSGYTYDLKKTKIIADGGACGLYNTLCRWIETDFCLCLVEKVLNHVINEMREIKC